MITINEHMAEVFIIGSALLAILFGLINAFIVLRIKITSVEEDMMAIRDDS
jgi:Na+/H+-translocating membrane pyrophosphatase